MASSHSGQPNLAVPAHYAIAAVREFLLDLQARICAALEQQEQSVGGSGRFVADPWQRPEGGGGQSCVLQGGKLIEKAGVMFSHIEIQHLPPSATARHPEIAGARAQALGVSLVVHPRNPYVPTSHANVRLFVAHKEGHAPVWWFGGGFDLTPFYPQIEDCIAWHQVAYTLCQPFGEAIYPRYKQWCDDYFYIKHRDEQRGIGGLFFDDLNQGTHGWDFATCFDFMQSVGNGYLQAILPLFEKYKNHPYGEREREFQLYRRGRYVEYNLVYDRGTLFGLQTGGRIESILVSLPPVTGWSYRQEWPEDSPEKKLTDYFLKPRQWLEI